MHKVRDPVDLPDSGLTSDQHAGQLMKEWKRLLANHPSASIVIATTGSKRKAVRSISNAEYCLSHRWIGRQRWWGRDQEQTRQWHSCQGTCFLASDWLDANISSMPSYALINWRYVSIVRPCISIFLQVPSFFSHRNSWNRKDNPHLERKMNYWSGSLTGFLPTSDRYHESSSMYPHLMTTQIDCA